MSNHSLTSNTDRPKKNLASFYKKEEISRNRVVQTDIRKFKNNRALPSLGRDE